MDESEPHVLSADALHNEAQKIPGDKECGRLFEEIMSTGQHLEDVTDSTISSVRGTVVQDWLSDSAGVQPEDIAVLDDLTTDEQDTGMKGSQENVVEMFTEKDAFLQKIHPEFLRCLEPIESGFMDDLRSLGAISESEEEEVRTEKTRKDKARKLWDILRRVPPQLFGEKCVPKLRSLYPHVLNGIDFCWDQASDPCLRHILTKYMTITKTADILLATKCCSVEEYRELLENKQTHQQQWETVFQKLKKHCIDAVLQEKLLEVLKNRAIGNPPSLKQQLRSGCPCVCLSPQLKEETSRKTERSAVREACGSSVTGYPNTDVSSKSVAIIDSESMYSSEQSSSSLINHPAVFEDDEVGYNNTVHNINLGLVDAAQCKTNFRKLQVIKHQVKCQVARARESKSTVNTQCSDGVSGLTALGREAQRIVENTKVLLERCQSLIADTAQSHSSRPNPQRHLLINETSEARFFYQQMESVLRELRELVCVEKKLTLPRSCTEPSLLLKTKEMQLMESLIRFQAVQSESETIMMQFLQCSGDVSGLTALKHETQRIIENAIEVALQRFQWGVCGRRTRSYPQRHY